MPHFYDFHGIKLITLFRREDHDLTPRIIQLWIRNAVLPRGANAQERAKQVVLAAVNASGEVIGVNTVYADTIKLPFDDQAAPAFLYRMFIEPKGRVPQLMRVMTSLAIKIIETEARASDPKRFVVIAENPGLIRPGMRALLKRLSLEEMGMTAEGRLIFAREFG